MKKHHPKFTTLLLLSGLFAFYTSPVFAQSVLFDFDNAPLHSSLPIDLTVGGITAHFSANPTYYNYSIQRADALGFTPVGFAGYCIYRDERTEQPPEWLLRTEHDSFVPNGTCFLLVIETQRLKRWGIARRTRRFPNRPSETAL